MARQGVSYEWHGKEVMNMIERDVAAITLNAAERIVFEAQVSMKSAGTFGIRSKPGEPPRFRTGDLMDTLKFAREGKSGAIAYCDDSAGDLPIWMEFGVAAKGTVTAPKGKVFHFVNERTGEDVFCKSFEHKGISARPFMRPAVDKVIAQGLAPKLVMRMQGLEDVNRSDLAFTSITEGL